MMLVLASVLLASTCTLNADGIPVCRRERPVVETVNAPVWITDAMHAGTACSLGVDIYSTAPGEAWYQWREDNPDARMVERVQVADSTIPDAWLFHADGEYVVFVFNQKLAEVDAGGVVEVHGECIRLIHG